MVNELRARELVRSPEHHQRARRAPVNLQHPRVRPVVHRSTVSSNARGPAAAELDAGEDYGHPSSPRLHRWMRGIASFP